jgi:hypothetical protein
VGGDKLVFDMQRLLRNGSVVDDESTIVSNRLDDGLILGQAEDVLPNIGQKYWS